MLDRFTVAFHEPVGGTPEEGEPAVADVPVSLTHGTAEPEVAVRDAGRLIDQSGRDGHVGCGAQVDRDVLVQADLSERVWAQLVPCDRSAAPSNGVHYAGVDAWHADRPDLIKV